MKKQIEFINIIGTVSIGSRATLELANGQQVQTSSIISINSNYIETKNSIYIKSKYLQSIEPYIRTDYDEKAQILIDHDQFKPQPNYYGTPEGFQPTDTLTQKETVSVPVIPPVNLPKQPEFTSIDQPQQPVQPIEPVQPVTSSQIDQVKQPVQQPVVNTPTAQPIPPIQHVMPNVPIITDHDFSGPSARDQLNNLNKMKSSTVAKPVQSNQIVKPVEEPKEEAKPQKTREEIIAERRKFVNNLKIVADVKSSNPNDD